MEFFFFQKLVQKILKNWRVLKITKTLRKYFKQKIYFIRYRYRYTTFVTIQIFKKMSENNS
jgi:hypothetical protein